MVSPTHAPWRIWWVFFLGSLAFAAAALLWQHHARLQTLATLTAVGQLEQTLDQSKIRAPVIAQDFVGGLPQIAHSQIIVDTIQRTAHDAGVVVTSLSMRDTPAREDQLGRLELTLTAQGSYPGLKQTLGEWLGRFPSATVRSQQWRRGEFVGASNAGVASVEANWVLSVWTRPLGIATGWKSVPAPASSGTSVPPSTPAL